MGMLAVPEAEPHWDYETKDTTSRDQMVTPSGRVKEGCPKGCYFDKLRDIQQEEKENPASFFPDLQRH
jgi:hypothetical protein